MIVLFLTGFRHLCAACTVVPFLDNDCEIVGSMGLIAVQGRGVLLCVGVSPLSPAFSWFGTPSFSTFRGLSHTGIVQC